MKCASIIISVEDGYIVFPKTFSLKRKYHAAYIRGISQFHPKKEETAKEHALFA